MMTFFFIVSQGSTLAGISPSFITWERDPITKKVHPSFTPMWEGDKCTMPLMAYWSWGDTLSLNLVTQANLIGLDYIDIMPSIVATRLWLGNHWHYPGLSDRNKVLHKHFEPSKCCILKRLFQYNTTSHRHYNIVISILVLKFRYLFLPANQSPLDLQTALAWTSYDPEFFRGLVSGGNQCQRRYGW